MKKRWISIILMFVLIAGYIAFLYYYEKEDTNEAPQIIFEETHLELSVSDDSSRLMEGVRAIDKEDGELTSEVMIDSISAFDGKKNRTVRYVVFDKENKATQASRTISYVDYQPPKILIKDSLTQSTISVAKINKMMEAVSCVDGDISNNVEVNIGKLQDNEVVLKIHTYDSTGTESNLSVVLEYDRNTYPVKIRLREYALYVPAGEIYDLKQNVQEILLGNQVISKYNEMIQIEGEVDFNTPGIYEVYYVLSEEAENIARTKGIVVVE